MSPNTPEGDWTNARLNYLDAHATHNASDSGTTKEGAWYYRYLQTFDLEFPELLGDYAYTATSRFTTAAEGATISDFGNNKVLGYWEHSYAQVNAEVASGGGGTPQHLADVLTQGKADAALIASMVHNKTYTIGGIKEELDKKGIPVRF